MVSQYLWKLASYRSDSIRKVLIWTGPLIQPLPWTRFSGDCICREEPFSKNIGNASVRKQLCLFPWACTPWTLSQKQSLKYFIQISIRDSDFFSPKSLAGCPWGEVADFSSLSLLTLNGFEFMYNIPTAVTQVPSKKIFWKKNSLLWSVQLCIKHFNGYWSPVCYHLWH